MHLIWLKANRFIQNLSFPSHTNLQAHFSARTRGVVRISRRPPLSGHTVFGAEFEHINCQSTGKLWAANWGAILWRKEVFFFLNRFHRRELTTPIFASDFLDCFSKSMEAFQTSSKHSCQVEMAPTLSSKGRDIFEWIGCEVVFWELFGFQEVSKISWMAFPALTLKRKRKKVLSVPKDTWDKPLTFPKFKSTENLRKRENQS